MTHKCDINKVIRAAAKSALFSWKQSDDGLDDLTQDLWLWYLDRPGMHKKLADSDEYLARRLVYRAALQILAEQALVEDEFRGNNIYSPENVKDALKGTGSNRFINTVMQTALDALDAKNSSYAEAIRVRYTDGVVPQDNQSKQRLKNAIKSLTKHVNIITIEASLSHTGTKLRNPIDPGLRAAGGSHSDPTGNTALLLLEHPELRDEYLHEGSLQDFLEGKDGA